MMRDAVMMSFRLWFLMFMMNDAAADDDDNDNDYDVYDE